MRLGRCHDFHKCIIGRQGRHGRSGKDCWVFVRLGSQLFGISRMGVLSCLGFAKLSVRLRRLAIGSAPHL